MFSIFDNSVEKNVQIRIVILAALLDYGRRRDDRIKGGTRSQKGKIPTWVLYIASKKKENERCYRYLRNKRERDREETEGESPSRIYLICDANDEKTACGLKPAIPRARNMLLCLKAPLQRSNYAEIKRK